ncbi:MAG: hypothetical protein A2Y38_03630 [Spirochaetes bacterium GWB1_59_5]|nr:MAG: hypothetical protein A2Y38_03630 [Spirochaetes bacterium GWB1_59_5]
MNDELHNDLIDPIECGHIKESLEKKSLLLEESQAIAHIGGWEFDVQTSRVTWTSEVYRIHGVGLEYNPNNLRNNIAFYTPSSAPVIEEAFKRAVENGENYDLELELVQATGKTIWIRTMGRVTVEKRAITRVSGNIMDITDRKLAQLELTRLNAELESRVRQRTIRLETANRELEAFAYNIAHDLKAPLRAISGFSAILAEDYASVLDDEGKRLLGIVSSNAERLSSLISDIVEITRIGMTIPRIARIAMRSMALAMYHEVASAEEISGITFNLGAIPDCEGDTLMMRKVWGNLLSNAIKFTSGKAERIIEVSAETSDRETKYSVRDNGIGFDPKYIDKLFKLFRRLHRDPVYTGTGAGLAIVRCVIELHGGKVGASSSGSTGTVFWFILPRNPESI